MTDIDANATADTTAEIDFIWPTDPPQDWWLTSGAALGLDDGQVKFAAALHSLGGVDSKKNSRAAKLANLSWDRVQAFRQARSVSIRKLLTEADGIKRGKLPPLSEAEIDQKIDDLIRRPGDALTLARGIELREKRKAAKVESENAKPPRDYAALYRDFICSLPRTGTGAAVVLGLFFNRANNLINFPFIREVAPIVSRYHPTEWARWREKHNTPGHEWTVGFLDECAAGPLLEGDALISAVHAICPPKGPDEYIGIKETANAIAH